MNAHVDPAQFAPADIPYSLLARWICEKAIPISRRQMDAINGVSKNTINDVRGVYRKYVERSLARHLSSNEYVVLTSIIARTLAFSKLIEVIPLSQFIDGLRLDDNKDEFVVDEHGMPYYEGTGLDKKTIRKSIEGLLQKGIITVFEVPGKAHAVVFAYSAMSLRNFYASLQGLHKEDRIALYDITEKSNLLSMSFMRDPVHDLEHKFTKMFPTGVKMIDKNKEINGSLFLKTMKNY